MNRDLSTSISWPQEAMPKHWVESLFSKMLCEYGKKFSDQWAGADPESLKAHWGQRLADLNGDELKRGVQALERLDWPPTLPEFRKLCRPSVDPVAAYYEAVSGMQARERGEVGEWSHPAIFWAAIQVSAFDLKNQGYSQLKVRWERALQEEMGKSQWAAIPQPMLALPEPGTAKTSRDEAERRIREMDAQGVIKKPGSATNHRAWIQKVLDRHKSKDSTLPAIAVRWAKEQLGQA